MEIINCDLCDGRGWYLKNFSDNHRTTCSQCNGTRTIKKDAVIIRNTTCLICHRVYKAEIMEMPCPFCGASFSTQIFQEEELKDDAYDDSECFVCPCGNYIEDGYHCENCGAEPPWGCPCSFCQDGDDEVDVVSYCDVMREDW